MFLGAHATGTRGLQRHLLRRLHREELRRVWRCAAALRSGLVRRRCSLDPGLLLGWFCISNLVGPSASMDPLPWLTRGNGNGTFRLVCFRASCHRPGPSYRLRWASARTWRPRSWPRPGATRSARTSAWRWAAPSRRPEEIRWAWKLRLAVRRVSRSPLGFPGGPKSFVRFHIMLDCLTSQGAFCPNLGSDLRPHGGSKLSFYLLAEATASDPSVMDPTFGFEDLTR